MVKIILIVIGVLYLLSPYDILPDFLVGWGWLDDGAIFYLMWRYFIAPAIARRQNERIYQQNWQYTQQQWNRHQDSYRQDSGTQSAAPGGRRDPYQVLGIGRNASQQEIRQAFKQLAGKYHPDKVHHLGEEFRDLAESRFKEIKEAYEVLKE